MINPKIRILKRRYLMWNKIKNRTLLFIGFTLINKRSSNWQYPTIRLERGQYITGGISRYGHRKFKYCPYSMDDPGWEILE